ncbi:MAG: translation initiation factor IF-2 [Euryarchaeota archaeon]|nr:translation initiation factor IF-2 [Euryarchaeota archaeon]
MAETTAQKGRAEEGLEDAPEEHDFALTKYTRQPIVSVLGHVDHGKTSVLDWVRGSTVVEREAGAITQHIGATEVPLAKLYELLGALRGGKEFKIPGLLFIDTPGHSAFTSLRARGGALADIAIVVCDITEGFKPQTHEAITILKQTKTPFVLIANKVDRIHGYKTAKAPVIKNIGKQDPEVQTRVEEAIYRIVGTLYELGFQSERFDRVEDYTKSIAIIPGCALSGEGIPEALLLLVGLAQRFLEQQLETTEEGSALGTVLEVKEEKGLGTTLDTIIYSGRLRVDDDVLVGTKNEPLETRIKAILQPKPLDEIRDPKDTFDRVKEVRAASGIKLLLGDAEGVQAGAPVRVITDENYDEMYDEVLAASRPSVELADSGVHIKADTIGSLEALAVECKNAGIPIRKAAVGPVSRRDITEASAENDKLHRVVLAFNVKILPDAETAVADTNVHLLESDVIYTLMEDYQKWHEGAFADKDADEREELIHPGKLLYLDDHTFRVNNPAIIGIRVLGGRVRVGHRLMREDGKEIGTVKSIRHEDTNITEAKQGMEVAMALDGPTVGRQIKEGIVLYVMIPAGDARKLHDMGKLNADERDVLDQVFAIRRKEDRFWGM